jgi:hypothetical protein
MNESLDVFELIELLLPFTVPVVDDTDPNNPVLSYRVPTAETNHRQYSITGVRANNEGDPVIIINFID